MPGLPERLVFQWPAGAVSRLRVLAFQLMGAWLGTANRFEATLLRNAPRIGIGSGNAFSSGARLLAQAHPTGCGEILIGDRNYFNVRFTADACGRMVIGSECMVGPDVYITDANHAAGPGLAPARAAMEVSEVQVGDRVWIGARAVILAGVELGEGCVVGAGAVVTRSVAPDAVVAGNPARELARRA